MISKQQKLMHSQVTQDLYGPDHSFRAALSRAKLVFEVMLQRNVLRRTLKKGAV